MLVTNADVQASLITGPFTANAVGADQLNLNGKGVKVVVNITAVTGTTPTLTVTIQGKDIVSGV